MYSVLETTRRCQVQQFQRHQNTFVLSYDITISIFLLLAYCFITIKLYQIDGQHIDGGGHHSYGLGRFCGNCHRYVSAHLIYELTYTECDDTDGEISQEKS